MIFADFSVQDLSSASGGLSLLKAILCRRLMSVSLYDLMERVILLVVEVDDAFLKRSAQQAVMQVFSIPNHISSFSYLR
jgi:hypothetical protein